MIARSSPGKGRKRLLTKSGAGALTLTGSNTYSGGTVINAGALEVASPQALGLGYVVVSGGTLKADLRQPFKVNGAYRKVLVAPWRCA